MWMYAALICCTALSQVSAREYEVHEFAVEARVDTHVQHVTLTPGSDAPITSAGFAFTYVDPSTGDQTLSDCIKLTSDGLKDTSRIWTGEFSIIDPATMLGLDTEYYIYDQLTQSDLPFGPTDVLSVKSEDYNGIGTSFNGGYGKFITITFNSNLGVGNLGYSDSDKDGNSCVAGDDGSVEVYVPPSDKVFRLAFVVNQQFTRVTTTTSDIRLAVEEPEGQPDISSCPSGGFKCEVEKAMIESGYSPNQIQFSDRTQKAMTIEWYMAFNGPELLGQRISDHWVFFQDIPVHLQAEAQFSMLSVHDTGT